MHLPEVCIFAHTSIAERLVCHPPPPAWSRVCLQHNFGTNPKTELRLWSLCCRDLWSLCYVPVSHTWCASAGSHHHTSHDVPLTSELRERPRSGRGAKRVFNLIPLNFLLLVSSLECNSKLIFLMPGVRLCH